MTTWNRTVGDVNDTIVAYLYGVTGTPTSSVSHVWQGSSTATNLSSSTVVGTDPDGTACLVSTIQLGTWLSTLTMTGQTANYYLEHQVTFADTRVITWPQPDAIQVRRQGG